MTYLDHAATTPMLPVAVACYTEALGRVGNPSSLHTAGRRARRDVEEARESIAESVGALPTEVVLATGGTEADNLAVKGIFWARRAADPRRTRVVVSAVEHHAVLDAAEWLAEHEGATLHVLPVDEAGRVHPSTLRELLAAHADEVAVVSVMWANNEVGTVNDVRALAEVAHEFGVPLHTDAVQAVGSLPVDFAASRRRRALADRAQARRPGRGRRAAAAPRRLVHAAAARRRAGARRAVGHARRRRHRRPGGRGARGRR